MYYERGKQNTIAQASQIAKIQRPLSTTLFWRLHIVKTQSSLYRVERTERQNRMEL